MTKQKLYFLCTGNSCRSQMAEGFGKKYLGNDWKVRSAGLEAHGLNPLAVKAMTEIGIDISKQKSEKIDTNFLKQASLAVTLCEDAEDRCPITPQNVVREHWGFDDPAKARGSEEAIYLEFQRVRDEIGERIQQFAKNN